MMSQAIKPNAQQLALLTDHERLYYNLAELINTHELPKDLGAAYLRTAGVAIVKSATSRRLHVVGEDKLSTLRPPRGLLVLSNHRTWFDQFVIASVLFRQPSLVRHLYFPVRAEYFYQHWVGALLNLSMAAMSMYPPIFRDPRRNEFNLYSVKRMIQLLDEPGTVVGIHPEGRRNKNADPYQLLPAQPGIGKIIYEAQPTVLPIFFGGMTNDYLSETRGNWLGTGAPLIMIVGQPLQLETFLAKKNTLRTQKEIADYALAQIRKLSETERALRAEMGAPPWR